jgi:hypothetical protein
MMAKALSDNPSKIEELRDHLQRRYSSMEDERSSFLPHWQDIADHIRPRSLRINSVIDSNKGVKTNRKIIDATATLASRTLRSGLMAGLTSPARPWFKLGTTDPQLQEFGPVKQWLYDVEVTMRDCMVKSNLYQCLPSVYGALGDYGTAAMYALEDDYSEVRFYFFMNGQYMIAVNEHNRCDSLYRRYPMTVRQLVKMFGEDKVSGGVKASFLSQQYEQEIEVVHCIEPNDDRDRVRISADNKPFRSVKFEWGASQNLILNQSGYDEFPIMAPRWDLWDDSCYGYSPGMDALGDIKALMLEQKRKAQAIDKWVDPPMLGDSLLRTSRTSTLPGDITYIDGLAAQAHAGFRPAYEIQPQISPLLEDIQEIQARIKRCYFEDMMQMITESDNPQMTAREIEERHSEKVLALGPVMERLNDELFDPLVKRVFGILFRKGKIKPPPPALAGQDFPQKIEYTSILAQASKLVGTANIERVAQFTGEMAQTHPDIIDKFNADEALDTYSEMHGINPNIILTKEQVKPLREARQKKEQMAQMAQMAKPMSEAAKAGKDMGDTNSGGVQDLVKSMVGG